MRLRANVFAVVGFMTEFENKLSHFISTFVNIVRTREAGVRGISG